jgi:hypothetical protein
MAANITSFTAGEGGRPKGAQNKTSKQVKEILSDILSDEIEAMPERLNQLSDKDRLDIVIKLLPYILPKQKELEITNDITKMNLPDYMKKDLINIPIIHWVGNNDETE